MKPQRQSGLIGWIMIVAEVYFQPPPFILMDLMLPQVILIMHGTTRPILPMEILKLMLQTLVGRGAVKLLNM